VTEGGEIVLQVAIRHELFRQLHADRRLYDLNTNKFTRHAARYGVGTSDRSERPHGLAAVVLDAAFVKDLTAKMTTEGDVRDAAEAVEEAAAIAEFGGG
jgi:hypothetical protein